MDLPQPALRPGQEHQRRHDRHRNGEIEAAEPRADQSHVVVERQPADEYVAVWLGIHGLTHGADVGEQVGMAEHHAFGIPRAAGGVLKKGDVFRSARRAPFRAADGHQAVHGLDRPHALDRRAQEVRQRAALSHCDQQLGLCIGEDRGLTAEMIFELRQPRRRIDRNRDAPCIEYPDEGVEESGACGQHQGDAVARRQSGFQKPARDGERPLAKLRVANSLAVAFPFPSARRGYGPDGPPPASPVSRSGSRRLAVSIRPGPEARP